MNVDLDCRGLLCPLPVIKLAKTLPTVAVGDTVTVLADDPAAATDIPAWCRMRSQDSCPRRRRYIVQLRRFTGGSAGRHCAT